MLSVLAANRGGQSSDKRCGLILLNDSSVYGTANKKSGIATRL